MANLPMVVLVALLKDLSQKQVCKEFIKIKYLQLHRYLNSVTRTCKAFQFSLFQKMKWYKSNIIFLSTCSAKTIPGTRSMHHIVPTSPMKIGAKRLTCDTDFSIVHDFSDALLPQMPECIVQPNCYVAYAYDSSWYLGIVEKVNCEEGDVTVRFMHPHGPSPSC
ncbi:uncharacterized protein LOC124621924 [Schistocerca americana]|uniref:uncharacterized protein LOC124621924 n=1 Tax=Schistocerca americana TaxID=7009 RepID=UPI001F4FD3D8|nr:uncharacterized protein LOC124621924 [Schistocerca americana]